MPLSRGLARFNRVVTNRISRPLAGWLPGFAVIVHRGRKSDAEYRTPVNAWLGDNDVIVALTYGRNTDWLKNLTVAIGGEVIAGRRTYRVGRPQLIGHEGMSRMPAMARPILRSIDVDEFALLPLIGPDRPT
jgi:deazaflavin-dependent oxidoreductase (nitroreductase family)